MGERNRHSAACNHAARTVRISASRLSCRESLRSTKRREPRWLATHRCANSYFGDAAALGAAIAGEGAPIDDPGAIGISLPLLACIDDLVSALAAAFACRLQR